MTDIKKQKVDAYDISLGMFVTDLDRPWIESPFMLQGFLIEDQADLETMRSLCEYVYVDKTKSIGSHFAAPEKIDVSVTQEGSVFKIRNPNTIHQAQTSVGSKASHHQEKFSFLEVLRQVKRFNENFKKQIHPEAGVLFNVQQTQVNAQQVNAQQDSSAAKAPTATTSGVHHSQPAHNTPITAKGMAKDFISDVTGLVGGLFGSSKQSFNIPDTFKYHYADHGKNEIQKNEGYRVIIYEEELPVENEIAAVYPIFEQSQIATRDIFDAVANEQHVDITGVSEILDTMVESIGRSPDALLWLAKLKQRDDFAYAQALRVSITLMAFGNFLAFSKRQIKHLGLAGLLQDIGKVKLSNDILFKQTKLTREEFQYVKIHLNESLKILKASPEIEPEVVELVAKHHERADGSGYPLKLSESDIPLAAQTTGLIDTYCAITSKRVYAEGLYHHKALDEMNSMAGAQFSHALVDQFVQFTGMYPVSSLVELNTGEVAVVIQQNQVRRLLPRLMIMLGPDKTPYAAPIMLNLLLSPNTPSGEPYRIVKSLPPDSYSLNPAEFYV